MAGGRTVGSRPRRRGYVLTLGPVTADLDLELALDKRYTELADLFADRRPSLYGSLAE